MARHKVFEYASAADLEIEKTHRRQVRPVQRPAASITPLTKGGWTGDPRGSLVSPGKAGFLYCEWLLCAVISQHSHCN